ncbi:MAG: phytoene/squalene synthase family protein [Bdellovibrionales bacterium]|nr:phytoene/squalene synthase family protein [Bdellovibrionales bacterium]
MPKKHQTEYELLVERCRSVIKVGSKSFSLSAHLFGKEKRDGAFLLYGWCRYCDDEIDKASASETSEQLQRRLATLRELTEASYSSSPMSHPVFAAFQHVVHKYGIPRHYPFELLEGMAMDIRQEKYPDLDTVVLYAYRVAGCVGLMMAHVMGVSSDKALRHASDMGIAMQLTNIARDVYEDASMGRVYLPEVWLREEGIARDAIREACNTPKLVRVVSRLLDVADGYYASGDAGLKYLSLRSACTVASARYVYAEIGNRVRMRGIHAWSTRTWVSLPRKLLVMCIGVMKVFLTRPFGKGWTAHRIGMVWEHAGILFGYLFFGS